MKEVNIISKVVGRRGAEASPSSAIIPNMSGYATKSELNTLRDEFKDFLEGADADVIINKWQDLVSFLEGISEDFDLLSMLGLKADKSELSNYVTLATKQPITGEKNFTGGLKVNGSPIVYDATNKYWKLEGDLLVTGGVTMFASDSAFTPSTIMDAIATDGTNLKVVNGVLTFVGSIDGGEAGSVAWDNVEGKPSWITDTKPSYSYSEISGTPTLLSSFNNDLGFITSTALTGYLPLSGGVINGRITTEGRIVIRNGNPIQFDRGDNKEILLGLYSQSSNDLYYYNGGTWGKVWTAANDGAGSGLDADLLDGVERDSILELEAKGAARISAVGWYRIAKFKKTASQTNTCRLHLSRNYANLDNEAYIFDITYTYKNRYSITQTAGVYRDTNSQCLTKIRIDSVSSSSKYAYVDFYYSKESANTVYWLSIGSLESFREPTFVEAPTGTPIEFETTKGCKSALGFEGSLTGNASTATQLQTPRTIWGQSFDGSGDVSGDLSLGFKKILGGDGDSLLSQSSNDGTLYLGYGSSEKKYHTKINGYGIRFHYGTSHTEGMRLTTGGDVLIGTTTDSGYKLDVIGDIRSTTNVRTPIATIDGIPIYKSQDDVLYIDGNLAVRGGITMYATDAIDVPSIIDALPIASASAKGIAAFNPNDFSVVDGYVSFIGKGGVDESVLADYAKKTDLSAYLPLSGGELSNTGYVLTINRLENDPAWLQFKSNWEVQGSIGAYNNSLLWLDKNYNSHTILHSGNWSQFVTAGDGGNYLPLSGGTMTSGVRLDAAANIYLQSTSNNNWNVFDVNGKRAFCVESGGYVGVGRSYDSGKTYRLAVEGNSYIGGYEVLQVSANGAGEYNRLCLSTVYMPNGENWQSEIISDYYGNNVCTMGGFTHGVYFKGGRNGFDSFIFLDSSKNPIARISASNTGMNHHFFGDMLVTGGITMYSDIRKKTKLADVELSLKQIADAPLIEHYYNSDSNKTTHVGSIAQYWAETIGNDWFCKLDSEGFYTMEIQNAALASAISIARELVKYESKTDRKIRLLKQRVKELEDKIEKLENN